MTRTSRSCRAADQPPSSMPSFGVTLNEVRNGCTSTKAARVKISVVSRFE